ncbi:MAG: hypothetical protein GTO14_14120 [Anaerolineales bacterium]|nr:hypothetical protein [Anaerolineales bacterium]
MAQGTAYVFTGLRMKTTGLTTAWILSVITLFLVGCNLPVNPTESTPGPATLAALTVEAILTQAYAPSGTPPALPSVFPSTPDSTPSQTQETPPPQQTTCTNRATFVADATIPDDTVLEPGERFLKIWSLQNSGTCVWDSSYTVSFFSGDRMGAASEISLTQTVSPNEVAELGVDMVAPSTAGVFQGFWRLKSDTGSYFGIGPSGDQSFWVKIVVPATATPTATATPSLSPTPTPSPSSTIVQSTATATATDTPTATASPSP